MYIPREYREIDREKIVEFMREHSFAALVSHDGERPIATHLPFVLRDDGVKLMLVTHMSLGNQQKKSLGGEVLVIFAGPHGYVSPSHYGDKARVPTWNYIAVHAYGKARITSFDEHDAVLRTMIEEFEPGYMQQYEMLPEQYKQPNMRGIVCLEIEVTELQAQYKLSQDKPHDDRMRVAHAFGASDESSKNDLADAMLAAFRSDSSA